MHLPTDCPAALLQPIAILADLVDDRIQGHPLLGSDVRERAQELRKLQPRAALHLHTYGGDSLCT